MPPLDVLRGILYGANTHCMMDYSLWRTENERRGIESHLLHQLCLEDPGTCDLGDVGPLSAHRYASAV